jgi:hypothetical protein
MRNPRIRGREKDRGHGGTQTLREIREILSPSSVLHLNRGFIKRLPLPFPQTVSGDFLDQQILCNQVYRPLGPYICFASRLRQCQPLQPIILSLCHPLGGSAQRLQTQVGFGSNYGWLSRPLSAAFGSGCKRPRLKPPPSDLEAVKAVKVSAPPFPLS